MCVLHLPQNTDNINAEVDKNKLLLFLLVPSFGQPPASWACNFLFVVVVVLYLFGCADGFSKWNKGAQSVGRSDWLAG